MALCYCVAVAREARLLELTHLPRCHRDAGNPDQVPVSRLDVHVPLGERRPPLDERPVRVVFQPPPVDDREAVAVVDALTPLDAEGDVFLALHLVCMALPANAAIAAISTVFVAPFLLLVFRTSRCLKIFALTMYRSFFVRSSLTLR